MKKGGKKHWKLEHKELGSQPVQLNTFLSFYLSISVTLYSWRVWQMSGSYLFSVHAEVGGSSRHRDTSFCQFDEILLNPAGDLGCFRRKSDSLITSSRGTAA